MLKEVFYPLDELSKKTYWLSLVSNPPNLGAYSFFLLFINHTPYINVYTTELQSLVSVSASKILPFLFLLCLNKSTGKIS
mgnify:CR=1 FL=1